MNDIFNIPVVESIKRNMKRGFVCDNIKSPHDVVFDKGYDKESIRYMFLCFANSFVEYAEQNIDNGKFDKKDIEKIKECLK